MIMTLPRASAKANMALATVHEEDACWDVRAGEGVAGSSVTWESRRSAWMASSTNRLKVSRLTATSAIGEGHSYRQPSDPEHVTPFGQCQDEAAACWDGERGDAEDDRDVVDVRADDDTLANEWLPIDKGSQRCGVVGDIRTYSTHQAEQSGRELPSIAQLFQAAGKPGGPAQRYEKSYHEREQGQGPCRDRSWYQSQVQEMRHVRPRLTRPHWPAPQEKQARPFSSTPVSAMSGPR